MKKKLRKRFPFLEMFTITKKGMALSVLSFLLLGTVSAQICVTKIQGDSLLCDGASTTLTANYYQLFDLMASNTAGNNHRGNMFDIVATNTVVIDAFDVSPMGNTTIEVYYKIGTWNGFANTPSAWTFIGSADVSYTGGFAPLSIPINVTIDAGSTVAFYVTSNNTAVALNYSNGTAVGNVYSSDANITFLEGGGMEYPFTQGTGAVYQPRVWNGRIHYSVPQAATYSWSTGETTQSIEINPSTNTQYWVESSASACGMLSDSMNVNLYTVSTVASVTDVLCNAGEDGGIDLTVSGGVEPYSFVWSEGDTTEDLSGLSAGTYTVTVSDAKGCTTTQSFTINQPDEIQIDVVSQVNVLCNGGSDGSVTIAASGGAGSYDYSWEPESGTGTSLSGLSAGSYAVTVTDINACEATENITITEPPVLNGTDFQLICVGNSYNFNGQVYTASNNTAKDTLVAANGCDSIVTLNLWVWDNSISPTGGSFTGTQIGNVATFTNGFCQPLAKVVSLTDLGTINMDVFASAGAYTGAWDPYVNRYFDINSSNPGGGTVTLYFTQQEFNDYNSFVGSDNEDYPQIGTSGENLQITAFHSSSGSFSGPGGYDPLTAEVLPCTSIWNSSQGRWEVTFNTLSFSGFFLHTKADGTVLPIKLIDVQAANMGVANRIDWTTASESEGDIFEIEASKDGRNFRRIGIVNANDLTGSKYSFVDNTPFNGVNYYRLHLVNADGSSAYSLVVNATVQHERVFMITAHPNPFNESVRVTIEGEISNHATISVFGVAGEMLHKENVSNNVINLSLKSLSAGTYIIRYQDDVEVKVIKLVKN